MTAEDILDTGYGPGAPPGDNVANDFQQETAASFAELARARGDRRERHAGRLTMTDSALRLPFWNRAVLEQPATDPGALVDDVRAFYAGGPADAPFLLDTLWPTPDRREHGLVLMGHPPLMVRPPHLELPAPP